MYGRDLGAGELYFGPPKPGQTFEQFETEQEQLARNLYAVGGIAAAALFVNPLLALGAGALYLASGAGGRQHTNKPKIQGG